MALKQRNKNVYLYKAYNNYPKIKTDTLHRWNINIDVMVVPSKALHRFNVQLLFFHIKIIWFFILLIILYFEVFWGEDSGLWNKFCQGLVFNGMLEIKSGHLRQMPFDCFIAQPNFLFFKFFQALTLAFVKCIQRSMMF